MPLPSSGKFSLSTKDILSFVFDDPSYDADRPVFIDPEDPSRNYTHRTAEKLVRQLIAGLHAKGLKPGETVCITSFNSLEFGTLNLAIIGAGGVSTGTNPGYTKFETAHAIRTAKVRYALVEPELLPNLQAGLEENGIDIKTNLFVLDTLPDQQVPAGLQSWKCLLEHGEEDWIRFDDLQKAQNTTAHLFFTSGTTGLPKCTMTSHYNLVAQHQLVYETEQRPWQTKLVYVMPFFHAGILPSVLITNIKVGREGYVMKRFDLHKFLRYTAKYQITEHILVPPMVVGIVMSGLADPQSKNYKPEFSMKSLMYATIGAAPCSADMQKRYHVLMNEDAVCVQVYGMTEITCVGSRVSIDTGRKTAKGQIDTWGAVGVPLPEVDMKLVDEQGNDVSDTTGLGELCVRGPTVVRGYFENEKANKESFDGEGYYKTGDVIRWDKKTSMMHCEDRTKELIKVRGFQVAPAELEGVLTAHPDIIDAAVIGVYTSKEEELPKAFVVKRPGSSIGEKDVLSYTRDKLAKYKQLAGGVEFVEAIPKSPSGKILKRVLRDMEAKRKKPSQAKL